MSEGKQVALVTGGSRGIGRAVCKTLAASGAHVFINYASRADAAEETASMCREAGGVADVIGFDIADSDAVNEAISSIKEKAGSLDVLVNNAGIAQDGLFVRIKDEDWHKVINVNLSGAFYCARAAAKIMMKARKGRIVNISSVVGQMGNAGQVSYVSAKSGMIGFTKALARELASRNITVNAVAPGFIETDMTAALDDKLKEEHFKTIPLGRYGSGEDIAEAVKYLVSDHAGYITGQVLAVNGGMYM